MSLAPVSTWEPSVNKNDLVERLAEEHELTKAFARELVDTKGEEVSLFGFGRFKVAERAARKGRNPRTGEAVKISASKSLKFTPARVLKAGLNTKRRGRKAP
jgi:DNA-binding protein HU-beta